MQYLTAIFLAFIATVSARADDLKPLTYEQAQRVDAALRALDGYQRVVKDGQSEKVVLEFYKLGQGLRLQIATAEAALDGSMRAYQQAYNGLVRQFSGGATKVPDTAMPEFTIEADKLIAASSGVTVPHIKASELDLEHNPIPASVLAALQPILDP